MRKWRGGLSGPGTLEEEVGPGRCVMLQGGSGGGAGVRHRHDARAVKSGGRQLAVVTRIGEAEVGVRSGGACLEEIEGARGHAWNMWASRGEG
jgi:hypothetical protein